MPQKRNRNSEFSMGLKEKLLELRKSQKMTQIEFANFVGVSSSSIGLYETGERIPDAEILFRIATKCNVSADYLLGISNVKTTEPKPKSICEYTGLSEAAINELHKWFKLSLHDDFPPVFSEQRERNQKLAAAILSFLIVGNEDSSVIESAYRLAFYTEEAKKIINELKSKNESGFSPLESLDSFNESIIEKIKLRNLECYDAINGFTLTVNNYIDNLGFNKETKELLNEINIASLKYTTKEGE